jgi:hypothetical protein
MLVIKGFFDLLDGNYEYRVGDKYPRKGYKPSKERIEELAGKKNKMGVVLIEHEQSVEEESNPKKPKKTDK